MQQQFDEDIFKKPVLRLHPTWANDLLVESSKQMNKKKETIIKNIYIVYGNQGSKRMKGLKAK